MGDQTRHRLSRVDRVEQQPLVAGRHRHRLAHRLVEEAVAGGQHHVGDVDVARIERGRTFDHRRQCRGHLRHPGALARGVGAHADAEDRRPLAERPQADQQPGMGERAARGADHGVEPGAGRLLHNLFRGEHVAEPAERRMAGVNPHIRAVCDGFAGKGFRVVAPALFDRVQRGIELEYGEKGFKVGVGLRQLIPLDYSMMDLAACVEHLGPAVAVIGYCWGGTLAWVAAQRLDIRASVGYYGGGITGHLDADLYCPVMLHFGGEDTAITPGDILTILKAYPQMTSTRSKRLVMCVVTLDVESGVWPRP